MAGIFVIAEHLDGQIAKISKEVIGAAQNLKSDAGGSLSVLVLSDGSPDLNEQVNLDGVDEIISIHTGTPHFDASIYEQAVLDLGQELQPSLVLVGHSANGIACAAAIAARLGAGFASDVIGMRFEGGEILATRSAHAGKVNLDLAFPGKEAIVLTCRGATFAAPDADGSAKVTERSVEIASSIQHSAYIDPPPADIDIAKAEIILSVGRGIQNPDNIPRFAAIADRLGVTLGCSRPFADAGHLPKAHQVGQSGTVASSCKLYIAIGISGAVQHLFGMKHIDTVIAVNNDPTAPIFGFSKYGSTVDALELADALEAQLSSG